MKQSQFQIGLLGSVQLWAMAHSTRTAARILRHVHWDVLGSCVETARCWEHINGKQFQAADLSQTLPTTVYHYLRFPALLQSFACGSSDMA